MTDSASQGLSHDEAAKRLAEGGRNELIRTAGTSPWRILARQFRGVMVWLLAAAAGLSAALGELADAIAIAAILIINALIGFLQERRAEKAVLALRAMTAPRARVLRDGHALTIPAAEVVVGDILLLEAGDVVAADGALLEAHRLTTSEAALTGESLPVDKQVGDEPPDAPLAERVAHVFMGTVVAAGSGRARVEATGMASELGAIAHLLAGARNQPTPLELRLAQVGRTLVALCVGIVLVIAALGALRGQPASQVVIGAISLAVAAVPEGLAAMVTVALALGVQRLARVNVLVRNLPSVETLGCTTTICTDKTGTLTTGSMVVREVWGERDRVLHAAAACVDADLGTDDHPGSGDPTELAILAAARDAGIERTAIERDAPRTLVIPFSTERRRMAVARSDGALYVKGAVEAVLPLCQPGADLDAASAANLSFASRGLRVLAVAVGHGRDERDLELLGLVGLADPPRPEATAAIALARRAGIRTVMITGDHPSTAAAIAHEMGVDQDDAVVARATAEDKLLAVRALKQRGEIVAMTGDGANDAPALREAHIGIAMGRTGTEVTREAADMLLTDDNYASIVAGIREGRGIYHNIQKTIVYLLAGNTSELLVMLGASLLGWPLPLLPLQLLWINLVTDGLPALALVADPTPADALDGPPRHPNAPILGRGEWFTILSIGVIEAGIVLTAFRWASDLDGIDVARGVAFSTLVFAELFRAFAARDRKKLFWQVGALSNLALLAVVAVSAGLQLLVEALAPLRALFGIAALPASAQVMALSLGLIPVSLLELAKLARRFIKPG